MNNFQMDQNTQDNSKQELRMEKELLNGPMEKYMKVNGWMVKSMVAECGKVNKDKVIWDNGKMVNHKVLASTYQF